MPGTRNNQKVNEEVVDLDALFASRTLKPTPVKVGGRIYRIRTDLTPQEVTDFLALIRTGHDVEAFTVLVGTTAERTALYKALRLRQSGEDTVELPVSPKAKAISEAIDKLPRLHQAAASAGLMRASKALADFAASDEDLEARFSDSQAKPGESKAS